jgi:hypothetical protein
MKEKKTVEVHLRMTEKVKKALDREASRNKRTVNSQLLVILEERYAKKAKLIIER